MDALQKRERKLTLRFHENKYVREKFITQPIGLCLLKVDPKI